jgi:fimbrial isopeptide formation D2 family protein
VQVKDTLPPQITLNNPTVTVRAHEEITPAQVIATLIDNCTAEEYMLDPANHLIRFEPGATFTCDESGIVATVYVKDKAGKEASATFTVQVKPMQPAYEPLKDTTLYTCNPDTSVAKIGEIISATVCGNTPVTIDHVDDASARGTNPENADYYNYDITRTWTVSAAGAPDSVSYQTISVRDTTRPVITASSATVDVYIGEDGKWKEPTVDEAQLSIEDCAGTYVTIAFDPLEFNCSHVGTSQTVTVTGRDPVGNESVPVTITVNVLDTLPPVFTPDDPINLLLDASGAATLTQSKALETLSDNCTDSVDIDVKFSREVFYVEDMKNSPVPVWVYLTDLSGNTYTAPVQVNITDNVARETTIEKRIQGRDVANRGDMVTFVITVTNKFGSDRNLVIVDSLPEGLSLVEDKVPGNAFVDLTKKVITINHGFLNEGATVSYTIVARVEELEALTNYAYLYRAEKRIGEAQITLNALQPKLSLTANIRDGDYISKQAGALPSDTLYNVSGRYRLDITLKNEGGATVNRIDVRIPYNPFAQKFESSSRVAGVTDNGNGILTWTVNNFDGNFETGLELAFMPLIAATYTFENSITTYLPDEDPSDNDAPVTVNQIIVDVPNVVTSEKPELHIRGLENPAIEEVTMKTVNIWGNQVYFARYPKDEITDATCWFEAGNLARGTYWYELVIRYQNGSSHVIRDYVEVLK